MLGDRRPRDGWKTRRDLHDGQLVRADEPQDLAPMRLGDRAQRDVGPQGYSRNGCGLPDSTNALSRPTTCPHV
jgi:hypothetical protein